MPVELLLEEGDQLIQFNGLRLSQIKDLVIARIVVDSGAHSRNDVGDICVVPTGRAISEDWDRAALADQLRKFVNREVRALTRAIDCEEAQAHAANVVEMRVSVADEFPRALRRSVWRDGLSEIGRAHV